jgi:hypothetical protein
MKNVLVGYETFVICPISINPFSDEDFKEDSVVCVGVRNPLL